MFWLLASMTGALLPSSELNKRSQISLKWCNRHHHLCSWGGTACRGMALCPELGEWPSTSPPGGVWRRQTSRRAPSLKPVAAARPLTTTTASNPNVALWNKKENHIRRHNIPARNLPLPLSSVVFRAPFWVSFDFFFFGHSCTREKPIISQWRGRFRLRQTLFSLRFLLHCRPPPLMTLLPFPSFFFLPRFVELKCSSRKEGQWMHTWFCFKQTNSFHWWCWWHVINDINKNWFLTSWLQYVSIWIWLVVFECAGFYLPPGACALQEY